jgi:hypothetical protein
MKIYTKHQYFKHFPLPQFLFLNKIKILYQRLICLLDKILIRGLFSRKRSISISSESDSDSSLGGSRYHQKKPKKIDEVERLAEMEQQRRQKEAEQKVMPHHLWARVFK